MRRIWAIAKKELVTYFSSPVAYIVGTVFLVIAGYFFTVIITATREAHLRFVFQNLNVTLLFIAPGLTMRLFAEEKKMGTFELLMTSPISLIELVTGKFLGAALLFLAMTAVTLQFPLFLVWFGNPDPGPLVMVYLGFILLGLSGIAIGMFTSSLLDSQVASFFIAFGILLMLAVISWTGQQVGGPLGQFIEGMSIFGRFDNFARGVLDTGDLCFYLSLIGIFIFLTVRSLDWKRW